MANVNVQITGGVVVGEFDVPQPGISEVLDTSDSKYTTWLANKALAAAAVSPGGMNQQLLFVLRNADMTLTTDQQFRKIFSGTSWKPTMILGKRVSGAYGVACLGGVYTAASKGGNAVVAAGQSWANLTGSNKLVNASLAAVADTDLNAGTPYLSLSTGNTGALVSDIFIYGVCLD